MEEPVGFVVGIILDPCRNRPADCCNDRFGEPAYVTDTLSESGILELIDETGTRMDNSVSRVGDQPIIFDLDCYRDDILGPYRLLKKHVLGKGSVTSKLFGVESLCTGRLSALAPLHALSFPPCWDRNSTVDALASCTFVDGARKNHCVAVGYMQNAYIPQCYGDFALLNDCGTFLELHLSDSDTILSQTRLLAEYTSGFRTTTLPLFYRGDKSRVVCEGQYEIWWVTRTRTSHLVLKKKRFQVISPVCDFDEALDAYKEFFTIA